MQTDAGSESIVILYSTFATLTDAERCGRALVEARLVACVNILPAMVSIYEWQGELGRDDEVVMLAKTRSGAVDAAREALARLHPYETPAILTLPTLAANAGYAAWLVSQTQAAGAG